MNPLEKAIAAINEALPKIRKWSNINSVMGPDLEEAGNILALVLCENPHLQIKYLSKKIGTPRTTTNNNKEK